MAAHILQITVSSVDESHWYNEQFWKDICNAHRDYEDNADLFAFNRNQPVILLCLIIAIAKY